MTQGCDADSNCVRLLVDSPTVPVGILGASKRRRRVRIKNEGPDNVYFLTTANGGDDARRSGFLVTPVEPPLDLDIETGLWCVSENTGARAMVSCYTAIREA